MQDISLKIIDWYEQNKRKLPWRGIKDPYRIWISEIILQQTRVNQGLDYYLRFVGRFPVVADLAEAELDEVLKYWQGLGYYSRARNLHKAACQIMEIHKGVFPVRYEDILKLSGVGVYTAAAISSLAFNEAHAVVDGNVYRVLSRLFGVETPTDSGSGIKEFAALADRFLDRTHPGLHNQALMEFGALQCVPVSPACFRCPVAGQCVAFKTGRVDKLPYKQGKVKIKERFFNYFYIEYDGCIFIQRREKQDIWKNLYEFPLIESDRQLTVSELMNTVECNEIFRDIESVIVKRVDSPRKHVLTHRHIYATFVRVEISNTNSYLEQLTKISVGDMDRYAFSRLTELFLETL
jgi:A/G-specific adenine glycosylase